MISRFSIFYCAMHKRQIYQIFQRNLNTKSCKGTVGFAFDIDGVLARGAHWVIPEALQALELITCNKTRQFKYPTVFLTNACGCDSEKAERLGKSFNIKINERNIIQAQTPLELYKHLHEKHCLFIGQGNLKSIAHRMGFMKASVISDITDAYPLMDIADLDKRRNLKEESCKNKNISPVEAIILMGEPKHWEGPLQVVVDLLMTEGQPHKNASCDSSIKHLPVIPCNMDLQYMSKYHIPRYGNGAFLLCLETLYKKVTGRHLEYTALLGKPSELTFRFAEHRLQLLAKEITPDVQLETIYMIGDNPNSDIVGANLYNNYIKGNVSEDTNEITENRLLQNNVNITKQTVKKVGSVLVCTGVYNPSDSKHVTFEHFHRDFNVDSSLFTPTKTVPNVLDAVSYILDKEKNSKSIFE